MSKLNLLEVFTFYLIICFVAGTVFRIRNYRAIGGFLVRFPHRWPKLLGLVNQYRAIFLRWPTLLPIGLTLALTLANFLAARLVWANARISIDDLRGRWLAMLILTVAASVMVFLDCRAAFCFGRFDSVALETDLDRAEHWLQTWKAPALRVLTFGLINPRKLVNVQIQQALVDASLVVNGQMWRWSLQIGVRMAFGLALWTTWAVAVVEPAKVALVTVP